MSLVLGVLALVAVPLRASDPIGVYCIVDKVVLEPNNTEPLTIQVWGSFSFATRLPSGTAIYGPVQKGYLYFTCAKGTERTCLNEWADLKSVAGTRQIVGFGSRYTSVATVANAGRLRAASEAPARPDPYPLNAGVAKLGGARGRSIESLAGNNVTVSDNYNAIVKALNASATAR